MLIFEPGESKFRAGSNRIKIYYKIQKKIRTHLAAISYFRIY